MDISLFRKHAGFILGDEMQFLSEVSLIYKGVLNPLEVLIEASKSDEGRSDLASKEILPVVLRLVLSVCRKSDHRNLLLSLRLLRNLCAGEARNQNLFIEQEGVEIISAVISYVGLECGDSGYEIVRSALQVLANVSLAGIKHQGLIWDQCFPDLFLNVARVCRKEICDPLSMIIYTCSDGSIELFTQLCGRPGLAIVAEIVRTASEVGFKEDWLKLLMSRICLEKSHFAALSAVLNEDGGSADVLTDAQCGDALYKSSQAYLLRIVSEILNERLEEIHMGDAFALCVLSIFERAVKAVDFYTRAESRLPTGSASIDALGYSLTILRDVCAQGSSNVTDSEKGTEDVVYTLVDEGFLDVLLSLLRELELPSSIRKTMKQNESQGETSRVPKVCPYKGFRRDIVAVIGNCCYRRKYVQDEVRQKDGVILLLQQCVLDKDNEYLREWGLWCARNLLEGNAENQQLVAALEMERAADVPELANLGLQVEIDPKTGRPRLVNAT